MPVKTVQVEKQRVNKVNQVGQKGIQVEIIAGDPFSRLNQPNHMSVNKDGSFYVCFGKKRVPDDKEDRNYQFYIFLLRPEIEKGELTALVEAWYQLRSTDDCRRDFLRINEQILNLISRPAQVEMKENGFLLRPVDPNTEIEASLVIYTTFENDIGFSLPEEIIGEPLHGKFNKDGHVVAFVTEIDQTVTFTTRNGVKVKVEINVPNSNENEPVLVEEDVEFVHS